MKYIQVIFEFFGYIDTLKKHQKIQTIAIC